MKKLSLIALMAILALSLAACGMNNADDTTVPTTLPTTVPTTENSVLPEMDPTSATNVPDPDVEGAVPDGNDGMDALPDGTTGQGNNANGSGENSGNSGNGSGGNSGNSGNGAMGSTNGNTTGGTGN